MYQRILFVDFDGTITAEDTLNGALRLFASEEEYAEKHKEMLEGKITLSQALHLVFDRTPSARLPEMLQYVENIQIRPGFDAFLNEMEQLEIPVVVISGGLRQLIETKLGHYRHRFLGMHYVDLDVSGEKMRLVSEFDDGKEVLKKTDIMAMYPYETAICVGDSYTDINMAMASDVIFARDILAKYLEKAGKSFHKWEDFYDVIDAIKSSK